MKKSDELKQAITAKQTEMERLQSEGKTQEALNAADQLTGLINEHKLALRSEQADFELFKANATALSAGSRQESDAVLRNRAFNKLVFNRGTLTAEERRAYYNDGSSTTVSPALMETTSTKGGVLVPPEHITTLREYRKAYTALKDYCHVVTANSTTGSYPTLGEESGTLTNFSELTAIKKSAFEFGQVNYSISDYGDIIQLSNQLIADANVDLIGIIGQRFARKCVNTENAAILTLLTTNLTATTITSYKQLMKALNVDLDPVYFSSARIYTNQDGFNWLATLEDENKRPLTTPDITEPDTYRFRGKEIVVLSNSILATTAGKAPIFIGNMADYVMFFERSGIEVAVSTEYLFDSYGTAIRAIERFGVAADDTNAMKAYLVAVS